MEFGKLRTTIKHYHKEKLLFIKRYYEKAKYKLGEPQQHITDNNIKNTKFLGIYLTKYVQELQ